MHLFQQACCLDTMSKFFLSHTFRGRMTHIVDDLWANKDGKDSNITAM